VERAVIPLLQGLKARQLPFWQRFEKTFFHTPILQWNMPWVGDQDNNHSTHSDSEVSIRNKIQETVLVA
jgi:hypothetical protein